ncbi:MFS transporter [Corynebacterium uropygiale]|uniref:MFS transporter n=1 Tax=Corynebacterium uropygiale TaxID=1775911 RepID=A0A9X1QTL5_9CORY|nr:MFS transporter [Corynebacterium uropygiale]MCF4007598.1 MFS transporter [Corynebacterium uropygiale]
MTALLSHLSRRTTTVMLLAAILPLLDSSLVNVLLPAVSADMEVTQRTAQLGISGYMLAATAGIVLSTTCLRRFGARQVFVASLVVFAVASAVVGLSWAFGVFVAARVFQGAACGFIMPAVQALAAEIVGREGMRAALATIGLPAVIAPAFGPLVGGLLVGAVGWRVLFLVNVPLVLLAMLLLPGALPKTAPARCPLGLGQAVPALVGMVGLLWAITSIGARPAPWILVILGIALVSTLIFVLCDSRATVPLLDVLVYRQVPFCIAMLLCFIVGAVFYGTLLSTSIHIQGDLRQPAWVAGVILGVQGAGAWAVRRLVKGRWKSVNAFVLIAYGLLVAAVGTLGLQALSTWTASTIVLALLSSAIRGLGLGAATLLALSAAYEVVSHEKTQAVGAHSRLMLQLGGALGAAGVGVWHGSALGLGLGVAVCALIGACGAGLLVRAQHQAS